MEKLDYSLTDTDARIQLVNKIIANTPPQDLTSKYLEYLADYIVIPITKQEKKQQQILTPNRMVTINKMETSYEGLEAGEDAIYNIMADGGKGIILNPKSAITEQDIAEIPGLAALKEAITAVEETAKTATGRRRYKLGQQLIQMRQDQYALKAAFRKPVYFSHYYRSPRYMSLAEDATVNAEGDITSNGSLSLYNPLHISAMLSNYSLLAESVQDSLPSDLSCILDELNELLINYLKEEYPIYYQIVQLKIAGKSNLEIQAEIPYKYTVEYISNLWRNKIPKLLATEAQNRFLEWYFTYKAAGQWKKCSRCGQIKLAHPRFFSKNKASKDGYYSICKECRNKKKE